MNMKIQKQHEVSKLILHILFIRFYCLAANNKAGPVWVQGKEIRNFMAEHYLPYSIARKQYLQPQPQSFAKVTASEENKNFRAKIANLSEEMCLLLEELKALKKNLTKPHVKGTAISSQAEKAALENVRSHKT